MLRWIKAKLLAFLVKGFQREYAAELTKAKRSIPYEEWLQLAGKQGDNADSRYYPGILENGYQGGASPADRCAISQQQGIALLKEQGILLIVQRDGYIDPLAFSWIADYFRKHPRIQLLYGDEDVFDAAGRRRESPCFKPDWSPDTWLSCFYLGSVIALRRELAERLPASYREIRLQNAEQGLYFEEPEQVRLLVHQLLELAGGFERGYDSIAHLRGMLFHMRCDAAENGRQKAYYRKDGFCVPGEMPREAASDDSRPVVISVIIPSKDNPDVLEQCLNALRKCQEKISCTEILTETAESENPQTCYRMEILVVDNGSSPENRHKIEKITHGMKYIYEPAPFNFSAMCNRGAQVATGEILLFLNDDITVCGDGWLEAMADRTLRPYVGAVGLKLYYPDSTKIQHAGIVNLPGGPVHKLQFTLDGQEEDYGYGSLDRNVIGVTGACLMVQRERFRQAGGFPEDLQVAYNDVELCFRLREAGWHNVVINSFYAYHYESLSRGVDLTKEKMLRLRQERETLYARHPRYAFFDPYYPEPLCRELGDMHVREVYLDIRAGVQVASGSRRLAKCPEQEPENLIFVLQPAVETVPQVLSTDRDRDKCFCLQGYLVVRWDNNACYERYLLLRESGKTDGAHVIRLEAQYSREAEYGEQEQPNVAMCGFRVMLQKGVLPDGEYQIGMQARSRMGRRRLTAWTDQSLRIEGGILAAGE